MKLQILVPQYKETDEIIKPLLDSIALQQDVDFDEVGVIIVNDGSDVHLSKELIDSYPYRIEYYLSPHKGVSGTRNVCLARSEADYVMFCDADDMFYNVCGLYLIFRYIEEGFDLMTSLFFEQARGKSGERIYVKRENDSTFVHGKVIKRQFIEDNHIWWNEKLTIHEDSFFNVLCMHLSQDHKYCPDAFYLWRWRDDSVCRNDPKYMLNTYNNLVDSSDALLEEMAKRKKTDSVRFLMGYFLFETYYAMNKPEWLDPENKCYRDDVDRRMGEYFRKWENVWNEIPDEQKRDLSRDTRNKILGEGMLVEKESIYEWLSHIKGDNNVNKETEKETP